MVIYDVQHQVLVMQRNDDANFWQSVTGTLEQGEQPHAAAIREVLEETGIDIIEAGYALVDCHQVNRYLIRPRWRCRYPAGTLYNTEHVFVLQVATGTPIHLTEHSAMSWLSKSDALDKVWSDSNREAIERFVPTT